jgi:GTP-binding protein
MTNFASEEGAARFQRMLEASGITAELTRLGIAPGDIVHIADRELTWGDEFDMLPFEPAIQPEIGPES